MKNIVWVTLFLTVVFLSSFLVSTSSEQKVGAGALTVLFGLISFILILYNYFKSKKK